MNAAKQLQLKVAYCKKYRQYMTQGDVDTYGCLDWRKQEKHGSFIECKHLKRTKGRG